MGGNESQAEQKPLSETKTDTLPGVRLTANEKQLRNLRIFDKTLATMDDLLNKNKGDWLNYLGTMTNIPYEEGLPKPYRRVQKRLEELRSAVSQAILNNDTLNTLLMLRTENFRIFRKTIPEALFEPQTPPVDRLVRVYNEARSQSDITNDNHIAARAVMNQLTMTAQVSLAKIVAVGIDDLQRIRDQVMEPPKHGVPQEQKPVKRVKSKGKDLQANGKAGAPPASSSVNGASASNTANGSAGSNGASASAGDRKRDRCVCFNPAYVSQT